jgi:hypothetical protein
LPPGRDHDVLLAVDDLQAVRVDRADVAGADAVRAPHLGGRGFVGPVTRKASGRAADDLVVGAERDLVPG